MVCVHVAYPILNLGNLSLENATISTSTLELNVATRRVTRPHLTLNPKP